MVKNKLDGLTSLWKELSDLIANLLDELKDLLALCQRFWNEADAFQSTLKSQSATITQEVGEPCVELVAIKQQMDYFEVSYCDLFQKIVYQLSLCYQSGFDRTDIHY